MLSRLHIENYKCLRDVTVDLDEFTILIGPNDSGKTSLLEVIQTLGEISQKPYNQFFVGDRSLDNLVWRKEANRRITCDVKGQFIDHSFAYRIELPVGQEPPVEALEYDGLKLISTEMETKNSVKSRPVSYLSFESGRWIPRTSTSAIGTTYLRQMVEQGQAPYLGVADALSSTIEYRFDLEKLCQPAIPKADDFLHPSGDNLAGMLDLLQNSADRSAFTALEKSLHEAVPTIQGIRLPPARPSGLPGAAIKKGFGRGAKALEFILTGNGHPAVSIPAKQASAGALLFTAFLTLIYGQPAGVLLIEEPENGLHPNRLQFVIDHLRKISTGEIGGQKRQVIITTHSPLLLNHAKPEEVRVFVRDREQGTKVAPMAQIPDINRLMKEFAVGELWYLLGEEKMFQGQPA
jgi:predicted ATPase